jgi:translation elongation factor EF-Tu-like GTPase
MLKSAGTADKSNVNVVMIGHVDAGKSTISGHLLYLTGMLDERTLDKFARESEVGHLRAYTHTLSLPRSLSLPTSPSRARSRYVPRTPALEVAR